MASATPALDVIAAIAHCDRANIPSDYRLDEVYSTRAHCEEAVPMLPVPQAQVLQQVMANCDAILADPAEQGFIAVNGLGEVLVIGDGVSKIRLGTGDPRLVAIKQSLLAAGV